MKFKKRSYEVTINEIRKIKSLKGLKEERLTKIHSDLKEFCDLIAEMALRNLNL